MKFFKGKKYKSFKQAALARGLLKDDLEWDRCMQEASLIQMLRQLRNLFCTICMFSNPTDPQALFEKYKNF